MEYICHFQEIGSWGCFCVFKVYNLLYLICFVVLVIERAICWFTFGYYHLFFRGDNGELRVGVRRLARQQCPMPSSVISSHSMHLGVLATASHAVLTQSLFIVYYKPRFDRCPLVFHVS